MSVLLVLFTFGLFIALDYFVSSRRQRVADQEAVPETASAASLPPVQAHEPVWVSGYQLPEDVFYHPGHTWARVLDPSTVLIGMDDFARKLIGPVSRIAFPTPGSSVEQGDRGFRAGLDGRTAELVSPVDGEVLEVNQELLRKPHLASDDPYGRGWVLKVRPSKLAKDLRSLLSGSLARRWMEDSRARLEHQLMALSGSVLQDGGEPASDLARQLASDDWKRIVREFLLT